LYLLSLLSWLVAASAAAAAAAAALIARTLLAESWKDQMI
jgi:hypothetical protein